MEPVLRASFATLAALSLLGGLSVLLRYDSERRLEKLFLLFHHGIALGLAVAALLASVLGGGDGRPLLLCAVCPLILLCLSEAVTTRVIVWSIVVVVAGLAAETLVLVQVAPPLITGAACAAAGAVCSAAAAVSSFRRAKTLQPPRAQALAKSQALALGIAAVAALVAASPSAGAPGAVTGAWAIGIGAAGAVGTAGRLLPSSPPGSREVLACLVVFSLVLAAAAAADLRVATSLVLAMWAAQVSIAVFSVVRASVDVNRFAPLPAREEAAEVALPSPQALAAMAPLLDDALMRRPGRPRVIARVPALDRARAAQPKAAQAGRREDLLRVDVVATDSEIDVDGDPADLAEALCAVLDNALRSRAQQPDVKVQVHLRGSPASVTFEVSDVLPDGAEPAQGAGIPDMDGPFMHPRADVDRPGLGVSLARARVLVERNGGMLLLRSSAEGSTVQLTMPRRMQKGAVGRA